MADQDESALDDYLRKNKSQKTSRRGSTQKRKKQPGAIAPFVRWKAAAAMDIIRVIVPVVMLAFTGLLCLMLGYYNFYIYPLLLAGVVTIVSLIVAVIDFHHFNTWTENLHFEFEGWKQTLNNKSRNFWKHGGEYWVPTKIIFEMSESTNAKHVQVTQVFLKRLQKRLNQWTVSSETHIGYSQPNGWRLLDNHLAGDMNARVMNLVRKRLSGEFDSLVKKMPGSIRKVSMFSEGKEVRHEVYHDTDTGA